jgi:uridine kinase
MPIIVGVAGSSASGKTSICKYLQKYFGAEHVEIISLDWFYKTLPKGTDGATYNWDSPDAFDFEGLRDIIRELRDGNSVLAPDHDYTCYRRIENANAVKPSRIIIVEGILALHNLELLKHFDETLFIDCDGDTCLGRRVIRDVRDRKYDIEIVVNRYFQYAKPAFNELILPTKKYAGFIVQNNDSVISFEQNESLNHFIKYLQDHYSLSNV